MATLFVSLHLRRFEIHNNKWCINSILIVSHTFTVGSHPVQPDESIVMMTVTYPVCLQCVCNPTIAQGIEVVKTINSPPYIPIQVPTQGQPPIYGVRVIPYDTLCMLLPEL